MKAIVQPCRSGQFLQFSNDAVAAEPYRLELAENTSVSDSRVSDLVSVAYSPPYNHAFPEPEV